MTYEIITLPIEVKGQNAEGFLHFVLRSIHLVAHCVILE